MLCTCVSVCYVCVHCHAALGTRAPLARAASLPSPHTAGPASRGNLPQAAGPSRRAAGQRPGSAGQAVTAAAMAPAAALPG